MMYSINGGNPYVMHEKVVSLRGTVLNVWVLKRGGEIDVELASPKKSGYNKSRSRELIQKVIDARILSDNGFISNIDPAELKMGQNVRVCGLLRRPLTTQARPTLEVKFLAPSW